MPDRQPIGQLYSRFCLDRALLHLTFHSILPVFILVMISSQFREAQRYLNQVISPTSLKASNFWYCSPTFQVAIVIRVRAGALLMDLELIFFFHNVLSAIERYPLADPGSLKDNGRIAYTMKIEIERAWQTIKAYKGSSVDDK